MIGRGAPLCLDPLSGTLFHLEEQAGLPSIISSISEVFPAWFTAIFPGLSEKKGAAPPGQGYALKGIAAPLVHMAVTLIRIDFLDRPYQRFLVMLLVITCCQICMPAWD